MPTNPTKPAVKDPEKQAAPTIDLEAMFNQHDRVFKDKLNKRYQEYINLLDKEVSVARRYEIKERIDELTLVYKLLFGNEE